MDTHETREKEMRASFVCVIQLFLSPMFFVRETIKIYLCSLCDEFTRGFVGLPVSFLSSRGVLLSLLRRCCLDWFGREAAIRSSARGFRRGSEREDPTGDTTKAAEKD